MDGLTPRPLEPTLDAALASLAVLHGAGLRRGSALFGGATPAERAAARAEDVAHRRRLVKNERAKKAKKRNRK